MIAQKTLKFSYFLSTGLVAPLGDIYDIQFMTYLYTDNDIIFNFIWGNKPSKVKRNPFIGEIQKGGIKMVEFSTMEKALKIFLENDEAIPRRWKQLLK